ncbi:MAG TPA: aldo/keto reductase, partial [Firmicutes bacterium]|nr:aldo/keto reductase [Bacillota bacterium]
MQYRNFGNSDFKVSAIGFGCMRLPTIKNNTRDQASVDEKEAIKMIRYAVDGGLNFIDTAYPYHGGQSEVIVGKALKDGYRKRVKLCTKSPIFKIEQEDDFERFLDEQLDRLQVDFVDYYLMHGVNKQNWQDSVRKFNLLEKAEKAVGEGLIRQVGFSFHDSEDFFREVVDAYPWAMCLVQYNYLDKDTQAGTKGIKYAAQKGMAVAVMEPLRGGKLAAPPEPIRQLLDEAAPGRPYYHWALQWLWDQPEISVVLSGMSTREQVEANLEAADKSEVNSLSADENHLLEGEVRQKFLELTPIPCTSCYYCMPCPQEVDIPFNFEMFNDGYVHGELEESRSLYKKIQNSAEKCIACGECEEKCPQHIEISTWMPRVHEVLGEDKP